MAIPKSNSGVNVSEYIHVAKDTEITLMTVILKVKAEGCLAYGNRNLFYIEGMTTVGSACCGMIESRIIYIPGFVVSWHCRKDIASGNLVSEVEPLTDPATLEGVKKLLCKTFPSSLFLFS